MSIRTPTRFGSRILTRLYAAALAMALIMTNGSALAAWVAFNDHAAGTGTHLNTTRWNAFNTAAGAPGASGLLKHIATGTNLPVTLTITTNNFGVGPAGVQAQPAPGTPAYNVFNGFVDFQGTPNPTIELDGAGFVRYTFSGLNPARRYRFEGTAVRGNLAYTDRWTRFDIEGVQAFTAAHSANVLTSNQVPTLLSNQCALNTGVNNTTATGDYACWDSIQPSAAGTFSVACTQYTGPVPGGSSAGAKGYGMTGVRLEELATISPITILSQSQSQKSDAGKSVTFGVVVSGAAPQFQWFFNGAPLTGKTSQVLSINPVARTNEGSYYVVISNSVNVVTSAVMTLTVTLPQVSITAIPLTNHAWRYDDSGADLGIAWRSADFNDDTWASGRGLFAFEESNAFVTARTNTILTLTNASGSRFITYYFRTHFTVTNKPGSVSLVLSNIIDDGAVMYLNGEEVRRFNMPATSINATTLASSASSEGIFTVTNLPPHLLRSGDNVLAVEVHQNSTTSADIVFGLAGILLVLPPTPLSITNQPHDVTIRNGDSFTLDVGVAGTLAEYQWYKDGVAISGAGDQTFSVATATSSDAGLYLVIVTNELYEAMSVPVRVTVEPSLTGPELIRAFGDDSSTITLTFDKALNAGTASNAANYQVTNTFGEVLAVQSAAVISPSNVVLVTSPRRADANYIVVVSGVFDLGSPSLAVAPGSCAPVSTRWTIVRTDAMWRIFDPVPPFDDPDPGALWTNVDYDDSAWGEGGGAFEWNHRPMPVPANTTLSGSTFLSSYFRLKFDAPFSPAGARAEMRTLTDDGAVFFLNGRELFRTNMPSGLVSPATAATNIGSGEWPETPLILDPLPIIPAENILAVELHQRAANESKAFALEVYVVADSLVTGPTVLTRGPRDQSVLEGRTARFDAGIVGATSFQWQMDGANIDGATNTVLMFSNVTSELDGRQVRIAAWNTQSSVLSTNATLRIVADLEAPRLLSAVAPADEPDAIVLTFSRAVSAVSAENVANYQVMSAAGDVLSVTNAAMTSESNVVLRFTGEFSGVLMVSVTEVRATTATATMVPPGSRATVGAHFSCRWNPRGAICSLKPIRPFTRSLLRHRTMTRVGWDQAMHCSTPRAPLCQRPRTHSFRSLTVSAVTSTRITSERHSTPRSARPMSPFASATSLTMGSSSI
jgi:hypothetical protein